MGHQFVDVLASKQIRRTFRDRAHIPHICHFFYTDRIFENQILHPKKRLKSPKTLKMSLKKSYICIFFTHSGKIYTWQKFFTQTCLRCLWQIKGMWGFWWCESSWSTSFSSRLSSKVSSGFSPTSRSSMLSNSSTAIRDPTSTSASSIFPERFKVTLASVFNHFNWQCWQL